MSAVATDTQEPTSTAGEDGSLGAGAVATTWPALRGGDLGSLPAVLGLIVLVDHLHRAQGRDVLLRVQLRQPALPGRDDHRARDGPGLRPAARRDRPVGRLRRRHRAPRSSASRSPSKRLAARRWRCSPACGTGVVIGLFIGLLVARLGIPSFVVTLAMFLGAAGPHAAHHRRGRHDRRSATSSSSRSRTSNLTPLGGLDPVPDRGRRLRARRPGCACVAAAQGRARPRGRVGLAGQGRSSLAVLSGSRRSSSTRSARATRSSPRSRACPTSSR